MKVRRIKTDGPANGTPWQDVPRSPSISSISPSLGDTFGGARITITGTNLSSVSSVTIGGAACTSVTPISTTEATAIAPARTAGTYDVVAFNPGGSGTLVGGYESWHPTVDYPAARVYQSDQSVTSASSATRNRCGVWNADITAGQSYPGTDVFEDGIGMVRLATGPFAGRWLQIAGDAGGHQGLVTNTVKVSDDKGRAWSIGLANETGTETRFKRGHTLGVFMHTIAGVEYIYVIGDDPFSGSPTGDIWRAPASLGGVAGWTRVAQHAWLAGRQLFMSASFNGAIYVLGGQTNMYDGDSGIKNCRKSTDGGVTFTDLGDANWPAGRGMVYDPVEFQGQLYIVGGGVQDADTLGANKYYNGVYRLSTSDVWSTVLADGHGQFGNTRYNLLRVFKGRLWWFNGSLDTSTSDTTRAYASSDGTTWTQPLSVLSWGNNHACSGLVVDSGGDDDGIYLTEGFSTTRMHVVREHTGQLVSLWEDLGSAGLDLTQATDSKKPIKDPAGFASQPGLAFTLGQLMSLASPDRGISGGVLEEYVFGRSLSFDTSAAQGINPTSVMVGAINGSSWNNFGTFSFTLTVTGATNAGPIVISTVETHGLATGNKVFIAGVGGNKAANGWWTITVLSATTFSLNGSTGSGAYTSGGGVYFTSLVYRFFGPSGITVQRGSAVNDDRTHMFGVRHSAGIVRLYLDAVQQGADGSGTFDTTWVGWDSVGAGYLEGDKGEFVVGAVVVLMPGTATSDAFRTKLQTWSQKWAA